MPLFKSVTGTNMYGRPTTVTRPTKLFYSLVAAVTLVLLFLMFCFRIVGVGQVAILTRFGQVNREWSSGVHLKLPWPIEAETKMNVQIQKEQVDASAATNDLQTVTTTVALNYHLTPNTANQVFKEVGTDYKIRIIDPILQEAVKSVTSKYNATDLIEQRPKVEAETYNSLVLALNKRGISVDNLSIVNFRFSDQFSQAIESKQVEAQNVQAAQYKLQQAQLNAQANSVQQAALTPEILEQQAIAKWNGVLPTYLGQGSIFNIPLNK